jgi:hypothetical protein
MIDSPKDVLGLICQYLNVQDISNLLESSKEIAHISNMRAEKSVRFCASMHIKTHRAGDAIEHRIRIRQGYGNFTVGLIIHTYGNDIFDRHIDDFGVIFIPTINNRTLAPVTVAVYMDKYQRAKVILDHGQASYSGGYEINAFVAKELMDIYVLIDIYQKYDDSIYDICSDDTCKLYIYLNKHTMKSRWFDLCRDKETIDFIRNI